MESHLDSSLHSHSGGYSGYTGNSGNSGLDLGYLDLAYTGLLYSDFASRNASWYLGSQFAS